MQSKANGADWSKIPFPLRMNMVMLSRYNTLKIISAALLLAGLLALCATAQAKCSRADVNYYLQKGLTRGQVTALCKEASGAGAGDASRYRAYDAMPDRRRDKEADERKQERTLLKAAVEGRDKELTAAWLGYTDALCIQADAHKIETRREICPEVKHRIYFRDLEITDVNREFLGFGQRGIEVEGNIKRKLLDDFKEYPPATRRRLRAAYQATVTKGKALIPIRKGYPLSRISTELRRHIRKASAQ